jgi:hypothetical protein
VAANKVAVSKADDKSGCLGLISSPKQSLFWYWPVVSCVDLLGESSLQRKCRDR